jgi:hypothetical protein
MVRVFFQGNPRGRLPHAAPEFFFTECGRLHQRKTQIALGKNHAQMWKPNQLLNEDVVQTLHAVGFSAIQIEYLGWVSGTAQAINKSHNPAKAAQTIMSRALLPTKKPNPAGEFPSMWEKFEAKKKESINLDDSIDLTEINQRSQKLEQWQQRVQPAIRKPSQQDLLDEE